MINQLENNSKYKEIISEVNLVTELIMTGAPLLRRIDMSLPEYIEGFHSFINYINNFTENTSKALRILYGYGWYVDFINIDMITMHLYSYRIINNENEVNLYLIKTYNEVADKILKKIVKMFPHRESIISKAFSAHKNKDYELSIPVLLTQIDGICFDYTKYVYFKKTKSLNPTISKYFNDIKVNELFSRLLEPFNKTTPLSQNTDINEIYDKYFLNRHMILHGKDINYATEINSCKTISFIAYVVSIFDYLNNSTQSEKIIALPSENINEIEN